MEPVSEALQEETGTHRELRTSVWEGVALLRVGPESVWSEKRDTREKSLIG